MGSYTGKLGFPLLHLLHPTVELGTRSFLRPTLFVQPVLEILLLLDDGTTRRDDFMLCLLELYSKDVDLAVEGIALFRVLVCLDARLAN